MNIIVIGSGMYVSGRGTDGYGVVLPAIYEWSRTNIVDNVFICVTAEKSGSSLIKKLNNLQKYYEKKINFNLIYLNKNTLNNVLEKLKQKYDNLVAIIAVPDHLHFEIAMDVIKAGIHVQVVKPLVDTVDEAEELIKTQEKNNVYAVVEMHKRLDKSNLVIRDSYLDGSLGKPLYIIVEYSQKRVIPLVLFKSWVEKTNIFQYLAIHYIDLILYITKSTPVRAMATGQYGLLLSNGLNTYDSIQAVVECKDPDGHLFHSMFCMNWIDPHETTAMSDQKIKIIGTKGRIEADQKYRGITQVVDGRGVEDINPYYCRLYGNDGEGFEHTGYGIDSVKQYLSDVFGIINGLVYIDDLETCRPTFKSALKPISILQAVNISLKDNSNWVLCD